MREPWLSALIALAVAIDPYRIKRLFIFLDPESDPQGAGFQIIQSKIAVGSGGWFGQGLMLGRQKMRFLPEAHTDFIFGVVAEELDVADLDVRPFVDVEDEVHELGPAGDLPDISVRIAANGNPVITIAGHRQTLNY